MPALPQDCSVYTRLLQLLRQYNITLPEDLQMLSESLQDGAQVYFKNTNNNNNNKTEISEEEMATRLHEFQIIKAVVLASVTVIILVSVCKMVFQLFIRFPTDEK